MIGREEQRSADMLYDRPGLMVFVGRRQRTNSTDVMACPVGTKAYFRAVHCVDGNHAERAAEIVETYRARNRALNQARNHAGLCAVPGASHDGAPWA